MRIGHGFDAHRFTPNKRLVLGGVEVPFEMGLLAHSDGDVIIHALCDALLGAVGLGDIGQHFSDKDAQYKGADSMSFLQQIMHWVKEKGYKVQNADITVIAEVPKMSPHTGKIRSTLAKALDVIESSVNIKATTTEGMGWTGRREGMAATAVVLLCECN